MSTATVTLPTDQVSSAAEASSANISFTKSPDAAPENSISQRLADPAEVPEVSENPDVPEAPEDPQAVEASGGLQTPPPAPESARSSPDLKAIKIPNITLRQTSSQSTSPTSQQTTANNTPITSGQGYAISPKPLSHGQRTNSSFATKGSPKIQGLSRTFTEGVSTLGGHKLWEYKNSHEDEESQWGVNWYMPSHMAFLGLAGISGAIGHHFYYENLHGHLVVNSDWTQRWGLALAFFIKFSLIGAVQIAYKQAVWLTMKRKLLKVKTIDSLFAACQDPLEFLNKEFLFKAFVPALLAGLVWLLPLCAIASPASLTSIAQVVNHTEICNNIPTLNFTRELTLTLQSWEEALCFWVDKDDGTEYYASPSDRLTKIATIELLSGKGALQPTNPCPGFNCTYTITFNGPAYQCINQSDFDIPSNRSVSKDMLVPTGNISYISLSSIAEDDTGSPLSWANETEAEVGTLTEPDLWIGYAINTTIPLADPIITPWGSVWGYNMTQVVMKCSMYTADLTYTISWVDGVMTIQNYSTDNFELMTSWSPEPPGHLVKYPILSGFHAAGYLFRSKIYGYEIDSGDDGYVQTYSGVTQTDLIWDYDLPRAPDFGKDIEFEFAEIILSIASDPVMQSYQLTNPTCLTSRTELVWNYRPLWLVLSYSLAVAGMLVAVVMGVLAYKWNGYGTDLGFSSILVTTRNKALDEIVEGSCLGNTPLPKHITQERLRFGELRNSKGPREVQGQPKHTGFGFAWQAGPITIGEKYS